MQSLEVSGAVRLIYRSLGVEGLIFCSKTRREFLDKLSKLYVSPDAFCSMQLVT